MGARRALLFQATVARRVPADWSWFFDQWVYGTAIPAYRWSYTVAGSPNEKGEWVAALTRPKNGVLVTLRRRS